MIMRDFNFRTKIDIRDEETGITYDSKIMMLGSCFTTEIGKILQDYRFNVMVNPFGTIYNPASILASLERIVSCRHFTEEEVIQTNPTDTLSPKKYASFSHHSSFARPTGAEFLENANRELEITSKWLGNTDIIIITLGTAWVFINNNSTEVVSNCHKRVAKEFTRKLLDINECSEILMKIAGMFSDKKIIFTVSPIRHFKDGAHGNQISKATLMLAIENVIKECSWCKYFPAYEIMIDELRDYRFYAEDMMHPSPLAVQYIFEKFRQSHISATAFKQMDVNLRLTRAENHIQK